MFAIYSLKYLNPKIPLDVEANSRLDLLLRTKLGFLQMLTSPTNYYVGLWHGRNAIIASFFHGLLCTLL